MPERIGVRVLDSDATGLKRDLLFFDRLAVPAPGPAIDGWIGRGGPENRAVAADIEWLLERGLIFDSDDFVPQERAVAPESFWNAIDALGTIAPSTATLPAQQALGKLLEATKDRTTSAEEMRRMLSLWRQALKEWQPLLDWRARTAALIVENALRVEAIPIVVDMNLPERCESHKHDVIRIVLHALPEPDDSTPWEAIVEFRREADTKARLLSLRRWLNNVTRNDLTSNELQEELEFLVRSYEDYMRVHLKTTTTGVLETLVVTTAESFEHLLKLRLGAITTKLFSIRKESLAFLREELKAPGREVSYISKARRRFADRASQGTI